MDANIISIVKSWFDKSRDWQRLDNKKASRIIYYIDGLDFDNHDNYDKLINEVIDRVITIKETFRNHILPI